MGVASEAEWEIKSPVLLAEWLAQPSVVGEAPLHHQPLPDMPVWPITLSSSAARCIPSRQGGLR